jgi:hypothetical protein
MRPTPAMAGLAAALVLYVPAQAMAEVACKPVLTFREVRFSEAQNQLRKWTGVLAVDAGRYVPTSGAFELKFRPDQGNGTRPAFQRTIQMESWTDSGVAGFLVG